jgi:glycine cleavage system aminomethyltransferase T
MMLVSPGNSGVVQEWAKQRAKEGEMKVMVSDVSAKCGMLTLIGPESENVLKELMGVRIGSSSCTFCAQGTNMP